MSNNSSQQHAIESEIIIRDYICHRIGMNAKMCSPELLEFVRSKNQSTLNPKIVAAVEKLAWDFEQRYYDSYKSQITEIPSHAALSIDSTEAQIAFDSVANELFATGYRWSKIIALISYAGLLSNAAVSSTAHPLNVVVESRRVGEIVEWSKKFFENQAANDFFIRNNGWSGFTEWMSESVTTTSTKQLAVLAASAAAMLGLSFAAGHIIS